MNKLPPMELNSWAGTWLTPKPSQSKLEWKSLWSQRCGDLNHVHSQLLSQRSVSLLLRFLLAALVSVSSDLLLQRILLQRLLSPRSGLFSLEALKQGLQANSGFPRRSDIFFLRNELFLLKVLIVWFCQSTQYLRLWLLPYGDRKAFVKFRIGLFLSFLL